MDSTLIILWVFTWMAIGLIVLRLLLRKSKGRQSILGDYVPMGAFLCAPHTRTISPPRRPVAERLRDDLIYWDIRSHVTALFAVGLFIAITIARLPQNAKTSTARVNRTTWASIELLAAAIDANAPVLYGLLKGQSEKSKNAALGVGSTGPPQGLQKRSVNESEFELQGVRLGHIEGRLWEIEPPKVQLGQLQRTG